MTSNIKIKKNNNEVSSIIIDEPKTYNSLSFKNLSDLLKALKKLDADKKVKVIILEGAGKGFSAGHNLKEVRGLKKRDKYLKLFNLCSKVMLQIVEGRKPVIAKINRKPMMKMLLTGEPINANYAKEIGLINDNFSKAKLNKEVLKVANKIASKSNLTIKIGKQAFYKQLEMPLSKAYAYTSKMMTLNMMAMDAKEGISAFLEKRKPKWKNK